MKPVYGPSLIHCYVRPADGKGEVIMLPEDELDRVRALLKEAMEIMECNDPLQRVLVKMRTYFGVEEPDNNDHKKVSAGVCTLAAGAGHIDDWLDQPLMYFRDHNKILNYVHFFFTLHRFPAYRQVAYREEISKHKLFVTYKGERWRVTGASRLGDIYLTRDLTKSIGYDIDGRVGFDLNKLTDWSKTP